MSFSSLFSSITDWFSTVAAEPSPFPFPYDVVDQIIERSDDKSLLVLARVSQYTLYRSRRCLFRTLKFSDDKRFDRFLDLLESPRSTIAPAIKTLQLEGLFNNPRFFTYKPRNNPRALAEKLTGLESLWLTGTYWHYIAPHLLEFLSALLVTDLQFDNVKFYEAENYVDQFKRIPLSANSATRLTLCNHQLLGTPEDLIPDADLFRRKLHLRALDSTSLIHLHPVWDFETPAGLELVVDSFHLRLSSLPLGGPDKYVPYISQFLRHVGSQLGGLFIDVGDFVLNKDALPYYANIDFSACTDLTTLYFGTIDLNEDRNLIMDTMWKVVDLVPPARIHSVGLVLDACTSPEDLSATLQAFPWLVTIARIRERFSALSRLKVKIGGNELTKSDLEPEFSKLYKEITQIETGLEIVFEACVWKQELAAPRFHWRDFSS